MGLKNIERHKSCGGTLTKYTFPSSTLGGLETAVNVYLPPAASNRKVPVLYYLAGLTCNEDNGAQKGDFLAAAADGGIAIVFPDTSPRGAGIEGEDASYDFGTGAGFYVNATKAPWSKYYRMYDFVTKELPQQLASAGLPLDTARASIMGHSMGGHGALVIFLRETGKYRSVSAFSPISHPTECPWGEKAFNGYLEGGVEAGKAYDAADLLGLLPQGREVDILVDCGLADQFLENELFVNTLEEAAEARGLDKERVRVRMHDGYDHSYYFVSTFGPYHVRWHAQLLHK
ncbi:S-formylglutathione hydrolase [Malassezia sp. CBS 17886]|nr:S-formylglutathione hydrolase [Malassezia sp. CBS 17886]